jgi:hypothetical protein
MTEENHNPRGMGIHVSQTIGSAVSALREGRIEGAAVLIP